MKYFLIVWSGAAMIGAIYSDGFEGFTVTMGLAFSSGVAISMALWFHSDRLDPSIKGKP